MFELESGNQNADRHQSNNLNDNLQQAISAREQALCQLCVFSFRLEVIEGRNTKVVTCKWYSEVK